MALVALFGFTGLDIGRGEATEVASVAGETSSSSSAEEANDDDTTRKVEAKAPNAEVTAEIKSPQPEVAGVVETASSPSLQTGFFTGDVEVDFPATNPDVVVIADVGGIGDVGNPLGAVSGHEIADLRLLFDQASDELFVGINFVGVGGDPEGDGDPASGDIVDPANPSNILGLDIAAFGGGEAVSVVFDLDSDGVADVIAGVAEGADINGFSVSEGLFFNDFFNSLVAPGSAYGAPIPGAIGVAPADTSASSPDIEFSIAGLSNLGSALEPTIGVLAFSGSSQDGGIGEEFVAGPGAFTTIDNPLFVPAEPELSIEKSTNGFDADTAAEGPLLEVGSTATFSYVVSNSGDVDLAGITVNDDIIGEICTIATLAVGESSTCTATAIVTAGAYVNVGTADGFADDGTGNPTGDPVTASDPSNHIGAEAGIALTKTLDGQDLNDPNEQLPVFAVGTTITFDFLVQNTGAFALTNIALTDDVLGAISCPLDELGVDESMNCSADHVVTEGDAQRNVGTVTGQPVDEAGNAIGDPISADDPAHHNGAVSSISLEKETNGVDADEPSGPEIEFGETVTFTYIVTNNGPSNVVDLEVTDDIEGVVCEIAQLAPGESESCELQTIAEIGQYANIGSVIGQPVDGENNPIGDQLSATDPSHHVGVCVDTHDGPVLYRGARTIWNTNLVAASDSTIVLTTTENGGSPNQPNEQVYIEVAGELYGPSPVGLGTIAVDIADGGQVRVLHISEVEDGLFSANSVVPSLCGSDLEVIVPVCSDLVGGPALFAGGRTEWETGLIAEDDSTIRVNTSENGGSPGQPNEQVYLQVGDDLYGPTFAGLGDIEFDIDAGGPVTVLHISEVEEGLTSANSVVPAICGDALAAAPGPACPATAAGPRFYQNGETIWNSGFTAAADSDITIVSFDNLSDFRQPNEQVYVRVGETVYGPTPVGFGELTFTVDSAGPVTVLHYSEINGLQNSANSVEFEICGSGLTETVINYLSED